MGDAGKIFDGLLVLQCQSGNRKAMNLLVKRHHARLCRHAYWYTRDTEAAADIVQDSWGQIIKKLGTLKDPNCFGSWAMKIVTRKSLDYMNKINRGRDELKRYQNTALIEIDQGAAQKELKIQVLLKTIASLPKDQQQVLRLFYLEQYSLREISDILEIQLGTVKSRLYHAREKLKSILNKK